MAPFDDLLHRDLLPALGLPSEIDRIVVPASGTQTHIRIVHIKGASPIVVRFFASARDARALSRRIKFVARYGDFPAPGWIASNRPGAIIPGPGFHAIAEPFVEGAHCRAAETTDDDRCRLAEALTRLHSVGSSGWGPPPGRRPLGFFRFGIRGKFRNRLAGVARHDSEFKPEWRGQILSFVDRYARLWDSRAPFALTHDKINEGNVLFSSAESACLIDLATLQFGSPGKDLAAALYYFCPSPESETQLKREYFDRLAGWLPRRSACSSPAQREDHFVQFEPLYRAWTHLSHWASKSRSEFKKRPASAPDAPMSPSTRAEREAVFRWISRSS